MPSVEPHVTLLVSGGLDSSLLAVRGSRSGVIRNALFVNYRQAAAKQERLAMLRICQQVGIQADRVDAYHPGSAALSIGTGEAGPRVVPGRNLWLVSMAISEALTTGSTTVWIGCNKDDAEHYPDCRQHFIVALDRLAWNAYGIHVEAPLLHMPKRQVVEAWREEAKGVATPWSCYEPTAEGWPCGTCNACALREAAEAT